MVGYTVCHRATSVYFTWRRRVRSFEGQFLTLIFSMSNVCSDPASLDGRLRSKPGGDNSVKFGCPILQ